MTPQTRDDDLNFARGLIFAIEIVIIAALCVWIGWSFLGAWTLEQGNEAVQTSAWLDAHPRAREIGR